MNVSPSALLVIIVLTTIANLVILIAVSSRSRNRARRLSAVEGMLSSSYVGGGGASESWHGPIAEEHDQADDPEDRDGAPYEEAWVTMEREAYTEAAADVAADSVTGDTVAGETDVEAHGDAAVLEDGAVVAVDESDRAEADEPVPAEEPLQESAGTGSLIGRDALTGLLDSSSFREVLAHEDAREQRYARPATVVVFELDGLSRFIDRLGPSTGDRIEVALADSIARLARRADYVARLEPGRYGVLLPETDEVAAINYVERIRRACDLWLESGAIAMRLAIGWASTGGDIQLAAAIRTATDRMRVELRRNARTTGDEDGEDAGSAVAEAVGVGGFDESPNGL